MLRLCAVLSQIGVASAGWFSSVGIGSDGGASAAAAAAARPAHQLFRAEPGLPVPPAWVERYDPVPAPGAVVTHGAARFTVLADALVRMEWSPHAPPRFADAGSFFAVHRRFPAVDFTMSVEGSVLRLGTRLLTLTFDADAPGGFAPGPGCGLRVELVGGKTWVPGTKPEGR